MKNNYIASLVSAVLICSVTIAGFSSCGAEKSKNTANALATTASSATYAATEIRSRAVKVTDKNGEVKTQKNGESVTQIVTEYVSKATTKKAKAAHATTKKKKITTKKTQTTSAADVKKTYSPDTTITLNNAKSTVKGKNTAGVSINGNTVSILKKGEYLLKGSLADGSILIDLSGGNADYKKADDDKVVLVLDGVSVSNSKKFAVEIECAKTTVFNSKKDTINSFSDGGSKGDQKAWACIHSKDDITFNGEGIINVSGNVNNGIYTKNALKVNGGVLNVTALKNGLRGDEEVVIKDGVVDIKTTDGDCIKADEALLNGETLDESVGFILIEGGNVSLRAGDDALQAVSLIHIVKGAVVRIYSVGVTSGKNTNTGVEINGKEYDGRVIGKEYILKS